MNPLKVRTRKEISSFWYQIELINKVENIEEDSLDSIPSPSPSEEIQIISGKVNLS